MLADDGMGMVHGVAKIATFFKYRQAGFTNRPHSGMLIMLVSENHYLPRCKKHQQDPGVNDISFDGFQNSIVQQRFNGKVNHLTHFNVGGT